MRRLGSAFFSIGSELQENFSEKATDEALKAINEAIVKLEEIEKNLKGSDKNE
jgi:hypothetical protein